MTQEVAAEAPQPIRLADYQPPAYQIDSVDLDFVLDAKRTVVTSKLVIRRGPNANGAAPLILNGEDLKLVAIAVDDQALAPADYTLTEKTLSIAGSPASFTLTITSICSPEANTSLSGLYLSNGMFCTQCEAEGFRRITYFPDRPDVLTKFTVRIEADKKAYPVLLSNGNLIAEGDLEGGKHFVQWADPHPKPAYLFALVGGDLACIEDSFKTVSGRDVALKVFVQPQNKDKCDYTLDALKRSMRWDEQTFGREYDLDIFMIVAVDHFNFGAMENKGLNIFNSAYVLASPETATDQDYETIESIVAHEYFHNWSGNRVTCRDWFQLCLKEGFTVFRDQEFSADMRSRPVQRIKDVRRLWAYQFPEDAGPLAHPPRPSEYITIDNFYTATVYEKGAELARMLKLLLGPEKFRAASDLYFDTHDGTAATVEDFVTAMEEASGKDLSQFRHWYTDAGCPMLTITEQADGFKVSQKTEPTPGQPEKPARHIPIAYAAYGEKSGALLQEGLLEVRDEETRLEINSNGERPLLSLLNGFSAPVKLNQARGVSERLTLMAHDRDPFNKWAVTNGLWKDLCLAHAGLTDLDNKQATLENFSAELGKALNGAGDDPSFVAELLKVPSASELAQVSGEIHPQKIVEGRKEVCRRSAELLKAPLRTAYEQLHTDAPYSPDADQAGPRTLKNACLALLVATGEDELAFAQSKSATNMTDEAAATAILATANSNYRKQALDQFYDKWQANSLVVNKWLAWRAMAPADNALQEIKSLLDHPAFDAGNPNKVRAVLGVFSRENIAPFHAGDSSGYDFFIDQLLSIDGKNPQLAARLTTSLESWRKLEPARRSLAGKALDRLASHKGLSSNVYEMASRLKGG